MSESPILFQSAVVHGQTSQASLLLSRFNEGRLSGRQTHSIDLTITFDGITPLMLLPEDATIVATLRSDDRNMLHAEHRLGSLLVVVKGKFAEITVSSATVSGSEALLHEVQARVPAPDDHGSTVGIWSIDGDDTVRRLKRIDTVAWSDIRRNYPSAVRSQFDALVALRPPFDGGRLIMLHGEPGTGKTNAIRSLIHEWSAWCSAQFISEPEMFFARAQHLDTVVNAVDGLASGPTIEHPPIWNTPWKLVIAEDTDELLRAASNHQSGGALGRLFNMADGILGQGSRVIYLITTNEPIHELHPALLRPGRCLSRIEFERFGLDEARAWMPSDAADRISTSLTLAELYEIRGDIERIQHSAATRGYGVYL